MPEASKLPLPESNPQQYAGEDEIAPTQPEGPYMGNEQHPVQTPDNHVDQKRVDFEITSYPESIITSDSSKVGKEQPESAGSLREPAR